MDIKKVYLYLIVVLCTLTPIKVILEFNNIEVNNSYYFLIPALLVLIGFIFLVTKLETFGHVNFNVVNPSTALGGLSAALTVCFSLLGITFFIEKPDYDTSFNYYSLGVFAFLSVISFVFMTIGHFIGKNLFKKVKFLIFMPAIYYVLSMMLFLSLSKIQNGYEMASQSFLALFFVYLIRVYVSNSDKLNVIKRLVLFGLGSIVTIFMGRFVTFALDFTTVTSILSLKFIAPVTYFLSSIYALIFVIINFKSNVQKIDN